MISRAKIDLSNCVVESARLLLLTRRMYVCVCVYVLCNGGIAFQYYAIAFAGRFLSVWQIWRIRCRTGKQFSICCIIKIAECLAVVKVARKCDRKYGHIERGYVLPIFFTFETHPAVASLIKQSYVIVNPGIKARFSCVKYVSRAVK